MRFELPERLCFKISAVLEVFALILVITLTSCEKPDKADIPSDSSSFVISDEPEILGEGQTSFALNITYQSGSSDHFVINTDEKYLGAALLNIGLIDGESSEGGLYVTTVNDVKLDYVKDKFYWAFYIDGVYAATGVDLTEINSSSVYEFKAEIA